MTDNLDKRKVARSFFKGRLTYDEQARVQRTVGNRLIELLMGFPGLCTDRVLEIGCCTGGMTEKLLSERHVGTLFLNDLVPEFYEQVRKRIAGLSVEAVQPLLGDIEDLALPDELDLVLSSSTFQWLTDLPGSFSKIGAALKREGVLAFSLFGPGTLTEFRQLTGVGLDYIALGNVLDLLAKDFVFQVVDTEKHRLYFTSPREILRHLQATGVGGVGGFHWTSKKLRQFEKDYLNHFGTTAGVPITYVTSYVIASKKN